MKKDNEMLMFLIAFILGFLVSRHMGSGFSVGCVVAKCDPKAKTQQFCPGQIFCPDSGECPDPSVLDNFPKAYNVFGSVPSPWTGTSFDGIYKFKGYLCDNKPIYSMRDVSDGPSLIYSNKKWMIVDWWSKCGGDHGDFYTHCKKSTDHPDECTEWQDEQPNLTITLVLN